MVDRPKIDFLFFQLGLGGVGQLWVVGVWDLQARDTSLAGLLSPPKCNIFFELIHLSESRPLIPHYLGELMAFQVKQTFYPTLHSMWVTAMLSIMALGAAYCTFDLNLLPCLWK